jgi:hypothetical protein
VSFQRGLIAFEFLWNGIAFMSLQTVRPPVQGMHFLDDFNGYAAWNMRV